MKEYPSTFDEKVFIILHFTCSKINSRASEDLSMNQEVHSLPVHFGGKGIGCLTVNICPL